MKRQATTGEKYLQKTHLINIQNIQRNLKIKQYENKEPDLKNGPKTLTDTSSKIIYRWQISIWKDAPHLMLPGKGKIKQQWDTTTHPLE